MALEALSKSSNSINVRKVFVFGFGESYRSVFVGSRLISWVYSWKLFDWKYLPSSIEESSSRVIRALWIREMVLESVETYMGYIWRKTTRFSTWKSRNPLKIKVCSSIPPAWICSIVFSAFRFRPKAFLLVLDLVLLVFFSTTLFDLVLSSRASLALACSASCGQITEEVLSTTPHLTKLWLTWNRRFRRPNKNRSLILKF